jgi:DNA-binding NarL/FixJ family response regulator
MYKIVVLENQQLYKAGLKALLRDLDDIQVIADGHNVEEVKQQLGKIVPDLILIDLFQREDPGIKLLKKIFRLFPKAPVLIITNEGASENFEEYIRLGVNGFAFTNSSQDEFLKAIKMLALGEDYYPDEVWKFLKKAIRSQKSGSTQGNKLTEREISVLRSFTNGLTYKEIGNELNISSRTVETHKKNILAKLKVHTTADMIKYAYHNNLVI